MELMSGGGRNKGSTLVAVTALTAAIASTNAPSPSHLLPAY